MINDTILIQQYAHTRDVEAFVELTRRYAGLVYGACLRVTRNHADAEDVAQECFLELAMKAGTITTSLPGWLHTLAQRRSIDRVRRDTTRQRYEAEALRNAPATTAPAWEEIAPQVDAALAALPEEMRTPVLLHYLGGRTQQEIAQALGIHQSTVSRRIEHGVALLRDHLREAGVVVSLILLAALLTEQAAVAAPATLLVSLGKCALAGIGAGATTTFFGTVLGKTAALLLAATLVTTVLMISRSHQPRQMTARPPITHTNTAIPRAAAKPRTLMARPARQQQRTKNAMRITGVPAEKPVNQATEKAHGDALKPEKTKTITATMPVGAWAGWALRTEHTPGWANTPPRPGEVVVFDAPPGAVRTFSGHIVGIDKFEGVEVGLVSLKDIYWVRDDTSIWQPVNADGTFLLIDKNYPDQNKCVVVRAPGRAWSCCEYIFKAPQCGRDMVLRSDEGRQITLTARVGNAKDPADFNIEVFVLRQGWVHDNNPLGYQFAGKMRSQGGKLTLALPAEPVGLYLSAKGAACDWEIIDPREADRFDIKLLREGIIEGTVLRDGKPVTNALVSIINPAAAFSLRMPVTDAQGGFSCDGFSYGGFPPGQYNVSCGNASLQVEVREGETTHVSLNLTQ